MKRNIQTLLLFLFIPFTLLASEWKDKKISVVIDKDASSIIRYAAEDLVNDLKSVTGADAELAEGSSPDAFVSFLLGKTELASGAGVDPQSLEGKWEAFSLRGKGNKVYIVGSDDRGVAYGVYAFTRDYLDIDPFVFWTERPPKKFETIEISNVSLDQGEPVFKYRGWFINDEDMLVNWLFPDPKMDKPRAHWRSRGVDIEIYKPIFRSMMRSGFNMCVPRTYYNAHDKKDIEITDLMRSRGIMLAGHHHTILGVHGYSWKKHWKDKGVEPMPPWSFPKSEKYFREIWSESLEELGPRTDIWNINFRGMQDTSFWGSDKDAPKDFDGRYKYWRSAVDAQIELLNKHYGNNWRGTVQGWHEVHELLAHGGKTFPKNVIRVWADVPADYCTFKDFPEWTNPEQDGVYFHVAYHGPNHMQIIPSLPIEQIKKCFDPVLKAGATHFMLNNVSDIREYVIQIGAMQELGLNGKIDPEDYLMRWCAFQYGKDAAEGAAKAWKDLWGTSFPSTEGAADLGVTEKVETMIDRMERMFVAMVNTEFDESGKFSIKRKETKEGRKLSSYWMNAYDSADKRLAKTMSVKSAWDQLKSDLQKVRAKVDSDKLQYFDDTLGLFTTTWSETNDALGNLCKGVLFLQDGKLDKGLEALVACKTNIENIKKAQLNAEHGKWYKWYERGLLQNVRELDEPLDGMIQRTKEQVKK